MAGVADALGDDQPDDDPAADDESQQQKDQSESGVGLIHVSILRERRGKCHFENSGRLSAEGNRRRFEG